MRFADIFGRKSIETDRNVELKLENTAMSERVNRVRKGKVKKVHA